MVKHPNFDPSFEQCSGTLHAGKLKQPSAYDHLAEAKRRTPNPDSRSGTPCADLKRVIVTLADLYKYNKFKATIYLCIREMNLATLIV